MSQSSFRYSRSSYSDKPRIAVSLVVCIAIILCAIGLDVWYNYNTHTYVATVITKDIKNYNFSYKYMIFAKTEEGKIKKFTVEDSIPRFRFNSSEDYEEIGVRKTYRFTTVGFYSEPISCYENIIEFQEISTNYADARQFN